MTTPPEPMPIATSTDLRTEDQIAVAAYMASANYRRAMRESGRTTHLPRESMLGAMVGLAVTLICTAVFMAFSVKAIEEFMPGRPTYVPMMLVTQTICLPAMICFSFATVAATFWYGAISLRVLIGMVITVPGYLAFLFAFWSTAQYFDEPMAYQIGSCLFAQFMAASTVSLLVQLFTRLTLSHEREHDDPPIPPTGLRSFFELTLFFAIGFAFLMAINTDGMIEGLIFFAIWGVISTAGVIRVMVAMMRPIANKKAGWISSLLFSFGCAAMMNGVFAAMEFSWDAAVDNVVVVALTSLYGTAVISGMMAICISILKHFGWSCVRRGSGTVTPTRA